MLLIKSDRLLDDAIVSMGKISKRSPTMPSTDLQEQGLEHLPDPAILNNALAEEWMLLTHDLGFGERMVASGVACPA